MPVKNAAGRLALWAAGTILGSCLLVAPASAQSQSQQASPSDQTAATLDPMLKETATQNHAGKGADNPPNLYGSPYDRTQPSLGTVRHPFVPVPGNEALFPASFSDWLKQPTMTG
ncbi:hypothetical protein, partial [Asaia sp. SF2.1]